MTAEGMQALHRCCYATDSLPSCGVLGLLHTSSLTKAFTYSNITQYGTLTVWLAGCQSHAGFTELSSLWHISLVMIACEGIHLDSLLLCAGITISL